MVKRVLKTHTFKKSPGFTLIEVVICIAILATGFMGVYSLHSQTLRASHDIQFYTKAPLLAQKKLSEISKDLKDLTDDEGDFGEDFEGYAYALSVTDIGENETLGQTAEKLKKITLKITYHNDANMYDITAYRFIQPDEDR